MSVQREFNALAAEFDILVIGAGVYGSAIARLAALQGLSVALIDRADFGAGTSHNSLKLVHGGFRYIQHFDVPRIRESVRAQCAWAEMAPHLVRPLRFVMPTHGFGTRSPWALGGALVAFHAIAWDRNKGARAGVRLPGGTLLSRRELVAAYPMFERSKARGGAVWHDLQMLDPNRLTLHCVVDAARCGAIVANHAEALSLLRQQSRIVGASVRCRITGKELEVRARLTVNAAGPWAELLLPPEARLNRPLAWTRNVNVVTRQLFADGAVGVTSRQASDAAIGHTKRLFFVTPWQDCSIIGTAHEPHTGPTDEIQVTRAELETFLSEVGDAMPGVPLSMSDVRYVHSGLTPAGLEGEGTSAPKRAHRPAVWDHARSGLPGLISAVGIKYTTAPVVAERIVRIALRTLGRSSQVAHRALSREQSEPRVALLARHPDLDWASRIYAEQGNAMLSSLDYDGGDIGRHVFRCRVAYGARHEMAQSLSDVLFRCTDLAERGRLSEPDLEWAAAFLEHYLRWAPDRAAKEQADARRYLLQRHSPLKSS